MVGVLVFKKPSYVAKTKDEKNADDIESLFNHIDDKKLYTDIKREFGLDDDEIVRASKLIPEKYYKFDKLWNLLSELGEKYKLGVINNGNAIALKYWKDKFDFNVFDIFINSAVEGVKKPDSKIFLLACEKLNVKPEECLFMDDSSENVDAAKKLGMQTIWWDKTQDINILFDEFKKIIHLL